SCHRIRPPHSASGTTAPIAPLADDFCKPPRLANCPTRPPHLQPSTSSIHVGCVSCVRDIAVFAGPARRKLVGADHHWSMIVLPLFTTKYILHVVNRAEYNFLLHSLPDLSEITMIIEVYIALVGAVAVELRTATESYGSLAGSYGHVHKRGLAYEATTSIKTMDCYGLMCFFPD
ncbi:hypothetical protein FPV67DRAFT_1493935, partial [Lyophyllum atratum]